jgi:radical S-adenosyl methionine domain-containing protein 2
MAAGQLPPTVNLHLVGHCNYRCQYCYARFEKAKTFLPYEDGRAILEELPRHGVTRVTFAGGEPTLHPDLPQLLRHATDAGLVTALVSNGSFERDLARRLFPWLRWLVLSVDSHRRATNDAIGRKASRDALGQVARVEQVVAWLKEWNAHRPQDEHVRLKLNVVVNALNAHEDPSEWLAGLQAERIKLLQCSVIPGENDDARELLIDAAAFTRFCERVKGLEASGVVVVAEPTADLLDSYAMVDPRGRFRQSQPGGYMESEPITEVGIEAAWGQVGGCDLERFESRGGRYDAGTPARGQFLPIIAIEGLDGVGKSTVVLALAARLGASVVTNPPAELAAGRRAADELQPDERRRWYFEANRVAMDVATTLVFRATPVVLDRSFASTAAFAAAEQGRVASTADVPRAVKRPDIILWLQLPEGERRARLERRGRANAEEQRLSDDDGFRSRVLDGYAALGAVPVDAGLPVNEIIERLCDELARRGLTPRGRR